MKELDDILETIDKGFEKKEEKKEEKGIWDRFIKYSLKTSPNHTHGYNNYLYNRSNDCYYYNEDSAVMNLENYNLEYVGDWDKGIQYEEHKYKCECNTVHQILGRKQYTPYINTRMDDRAIIVDNFYCSKCGRVIRITNIKIEKILSKFREESEGNDD
jgi:hypothetical protein